MNPQHQPSISPHSPNLNNYKFTKERPSLQTPRPTSSPYQPSSPYSRPRQSTTNPLPLNMIQGSTSNNPMSIKPLAAQGDDTGHPLRDSTNEQAIYSSPKDHKQKKVKSNLSFTEDLHKARSILDFPAKSHQDERGVLTERNMKSPMLQQQNQNDMMAFPAHMGNMGRTLLTPMSDLFDRELHLTTPKDYNPMNHDKLGPANIEGGGTGFFPFVENPGPINAGNDDNNAPKDGNMNNYHQSGENVSRTQDLLENFYSSLNQLPSEAQERTQPSRLPEMWNLGHNETLNFFRKLPFTEMVPEEYMNEAHQIQPQELDLPNDIVEEFRRNVQNATLKLQEGLCEINELFIFSQKTEKLCGDKENEMIHRNKEISNAFSNLSHYIWDYLQNQFNFSEGVNFSQESSLNFQDVREKITSQKFLSELNDDPALDDLLRYFNRLMEEENDENRDLRRNLKELVAYEVLDQELAKYLFGENFDCEAELEERRLVVEEPNPVEEEFKNQYLTISQDLIQMSDNKMEEEKVSMNSGSKMNSGKTHKFESFTNNNTTTTMNEEMKQDNNNANTMVTLLQKSGDKGRGQVMSNNMGTTPNPTTQVSVTQPSVGHFSEINTYQQQYIEFEEGFMPVEFEEESNYMTGFPFMGGEEFEMNGFDNENENESK